MAQDGRQERDSDSLVALREKGKREEGGRKGKARKGKKKAKIRCGVFSGPVSLLSVVRRVCRVHRSRGREACRMRVASDLAARLGSRVQRTYRTDTYVGC